MRDQRVFLGDEVSTFVGRRRELAEIKRLLASSRLVTLTGVGGVGKTRLARKVAGEMWDDFPDGVWFVELVKVTEPALLSSAVADTLGLRDQSARSPEAVLVDHLATQRLLLVFDNCEHLLDACGVLVSHLLRAAGDIVVLATSRQPLSVLGERSWMVPPLSMPDLANTAPSSGGYVYGHEALQLFEDRARSVQPDFELDTAGKQSATELCRRLDGLPLAIELAAVRLRALSIDQIVARLEDRYRLLSSGNRGGPARHQTLRAAVDWSFDLCSEQEKALWARLSTFADAFDLDAAEAVCADDGILGEEIFELLAGLIEKSIVLKQKGGGQSRYRMLETIKAYGREQLSERDPGGAFWRHHRDYYLDLAEQSEREWFSARQVAWRDRLEVEQANLWAALEYCFGESGDAQLGLHMVGALCYYWNACGHLPDGRYWLERALDSARGPTPDRAKALWVVGYVAMTQGDNESAMHYFDECLALAGELGDEHAQALVRQFRGSAEQFKGNLLRAKELLTEAVAFHRRADVLNSLTVLGIAQLAFVSCLLDDTDGALALCGECHETSEKHGERWALSWAQWVTGLARWKRGDHAEAARSLRASLEVKHVLSDRLGMSACVELLAWAAVEEGDAERAGVLLGASRTLWATIGSPLFGSAVLIATHDDYAQRVRRKLGEKAFKRAYDRGVGLQIDDAVALAESTEPAGASRATDPADRLTRREREVARYLAEGLTNKEIAERMVISRRTVEGHVEHVLDKMGFKSRTRVAAWLARQEPDV